MSTISQQDVNVTLATLANACELVRLITIEVAGNDIAASIDGAPLSHESIAGLAQTTFMEHFANHRGV